MTTAGPQHVDTAIIGGGIAGTALAYYLARTGVSGVLLLEKDQLGSGSTGASFAGVRQQFSTPLEIELSKRGLEFWRSCADRFEAPCPFHKHGYLFVTTHDEVLEQFSKAAQMQRDLQAGPVEILDAAGVRDVVPWLGTADLAGGSWTPEDGRVIGTDGVAALAGAARGLGVVIRQWTPVTGIERAGTGFRLTGPGGTLATARQVVVAAGVGAPDLLAPLGITVDVSGFMLHSALTGAALPGQRVPVVIDFDTGFFVEREGEGLVVSMLISDPPDGYGQQGMLEDWHAAALTRAPGLLDLGISHLLSGVADEVSDGHPNAGQVDENLWVLAGFAGHGVMHGPPVAELLARVMTGDPDPAIDLTPLDPLRETTAGSGPGEGMIPHRRTGTARA
ncbi:MAG TPA: FAD-dependent oxidoreductase [Streptosporangiaceae bacterium]|jgi:sarcosine oxidase subunit beta